MKKESLKQTIQQGFAGLFHICKQELKAVFKDQGVLIFFLLVPLAYPLVYAFIYTNEVVREVPVAVIDNSNTALSRQFIRTVDASADVHIQSHCADMEEGKNLKPIRNHLELGGKTIYIPKGSPALQRLENLGEEIGDTIYIKEDSLYSDEQLIIMVSSGDIDLAVCDQQIAEASLKDFDNIDIKTDISFTQLQAWVLRKDSPILKDSLDKWINQIREKGLYNRIYQRYYK